MTVPMQTLEALPEFELGEWESGSGGQFEYETGFEHEGEFESEEFFGALAKLASRAAQNPALRRIGLSAARRAIAGIPQVAASVGAPGSAWSDIGRTAGDALGKQLGSWLPAQESEWESEGEFEINPIAKVYPAALMEHLGRAATEGEDEAGAEAFLGALIPLAARLIPRVAPAIMRAAPQLIRGVSQVARTLRANPSTSPLVRVVPTIVGRTAKSMANQAAAGRTPTPQQASQLLARQTARTLSDPRQCVLAYQRSRALDRRYHQAVGR